MFDRDYSDFKGQYAVIPANTQLSLSRYVTEGQSLGHFLTAVVTNDLMGAFGHADFGNLQAMDAIVKWVYNRAPSDCWGSREKVDAWRAQRGLMRQLVTA
jgi:hypothetical protein